MITHLNNKKKAKALKKNTENETDRLLNNPANAKRLDLSIKQAAEGKVTAITIKELWK